MNIYKMKSRIAGETRSAQEIYKDEMAKLARVIKNDVSEHFEITLSEAGDIVEYIQNHNVELSDIDLTECKNMFDVLYELSWLQ